MLPDGRATAFYSQYCKTPRKSGYDAYRPLAGLGLRGQHDRHDTFPYNPFSSQKLIEAERGLISILDRQGIERKAGELYGTPEAEYRRLI
jgi:hypothetical protein